jgi:regulator of protease activity HflC (stomatin/prohibitin superfamily)
MTDIPLPLPDQDGPPPSPPPGAVVQSVAIGFRVIYIVTILLAALWLFSNFRFVPSDSQAVVLRFGQVVRTQRAGLLPAWPRPVEQVRMLPAGARVLSRQVAAEQPVAGIIAASADATSAGLPPTATPYLTSDNKVVMLDATLVYRIVDPVAYVLSQDHVAPAMDRLFRATATQVAASEALNNFVVVETANGESEQQSIDAARARVHERFKDGVNARLKDLAAKGASLGIEIDRVDVTPSLPPQAKLAFDAVLAAGQKADQAIAAAGTAAELRKQGADQEADRLTSAAQAVAEERTVAATVDTTSIVAIERAGSAARNGLAEKAYRERIGDALSKAGNVVVIDPNSGRRIMMTAPNRASPAAQR